jgi:hypothetical protein
VIRPKESHGSVRASCRTQPLAHNTDRRCPGDRIGDDARAVVVVPSAVPERVALLVSAHDSAAPTNDLAGFTIRNTSRHISNTRGAPLGRGGDDRAMMLGAIAVTRTRVASGGRATKARLVRVGEARFDSRTMPSPFVLVRLRVHPRGVRRRGVAASRDGRPPLGARSGGARRQPLHDHASAERGSDRGRALGTGRQR